MNLIQRIRNLWCLSDFKITEFDNKLVIAKQGDKLVFAVAEEKPKKMAQIIKRRDPVKEVLKHE